MLIRRLARPLLASIFIYGGVQTFRDIDSHAKAAGALLDKTVGESKESLPSQVPTDPRTLVRIDGAVKIGAGAMLALGKWQRLSSLALGGSLVPTTLSAHSFWELEDPNERAAQTVHFLKNVGLLGGLLIAAVDTKGKPSVRYQAKQGARKAASQAQQSAASAKGKAKKKAR